MSRICESIHVLIFNVFHILLLVTLTETLTVVFKEIPMVSATNEHT